VKPGHSNPQVVDSAIQPGGRFTATNLTLKDLIGEAYSVPGYHISGGPSWLDGDTFTINAQSDHAVPIPSGPEGAERMRLMRARKYSPDMLRRHHTNTHWECAVAGHSVA
jgi:uncharacterized protein (TIGR03435 family)